MYYSMGENTCNMLQEISALLLFFFFWHGLLTFNKFNTKRKQILVLILVTDVYQEKNPKIVYYSM